MKSSRADVVVIGAGPAGLAAAAAAYEHGAGRVVVVERDERPGGILPQCVHPGFGLLTVGRDLTGPEYAAVALDRVAQAGVDIRLDSTAHSLRVEGDPPCLKSVVVVSPAGIEEIRTPSAVLAMGCRERPRGALGIAGTRPAGVMTAGTAQRYVNIIGMMPGRRPVIMGSGDIGLIMARRFTLEGADVAGVFEIMPWAGGLPRNISQCLYDFGIPLHLSHTVSEIHGDARINAVTVCKVDGSMKPVPSTARRVECDTLLLSVGLIPENEITRAGGVPIHEPTGGPVVDQDCSTMIDGVFACGNAVYVHDLVDDVTADGEVAGAAAARYACVRNGPAKRTGLRAFFREGRNVRCLSPQVLRLSGRGSRGGREGGGDANHAVVLRCRKPAAGVSAVFKFDGTSLPGREFEFVNPGEAVRVDVPRELVERCLDPARGPAHDIDLAVEVSLEVV